MLHEIFEEIVGRSPDAHAVQYENERLFTYRTIDQMANQFAHYFRAKGIKAQEFVLVKLKRSGEQLVVLLALSKIGAIYVPISVEQPLARLKQMQSDCKAEYLITTSDFVLPSNIVPIFLDKEHEEISNQPVGKPSLVSNPEAIAYVAYSSGTTGEPKGIPIGHAGLKQWRIDLRRNIQHPVVRVLANTSIDFDAHIWDYLMALSFGATVHITSEETRKDIDKLAEFIVKHHISDMTLTPAVLRAFSDKQITDFAKSKLRAIYSTGEACTKDIINRFSKHGIKIYNCYGPTEATFGLSMLRCSIENFYQDLAPIGIPSPESKIRVEIVDESRRPVPEGQEGRLVILSPYITKGYLNKQSDKIREIKTFGETIRSFLTDDKFLLWKGNLYCKGRIDHNAIAKIRGQLVDISGIENLLRLYPYKKISDAFVVLRNDVGSAPTLIAYVVCQDRFTIEEMRRYCLESGLIFASIPTYLENLSKKDIPLTINGKIDRDALIKKKLVFSRNSDIPFIPPETDMEKQLIKIWYKILDIPANLKINIGVRDPFVYFGGNSINLTILKNEIKTEFKINLPLSFNKLGSLEELTVEKLSHILTKELALKNSDGCIELAKSGNKNEPALFLLPPISGESTITYEKICQELKTTKRIYLLNSPLLLAHSLPIGDSITEIAEFYCSLILETQPEGHICLAGWSSGGVLASEVAHQLEMQNITVDFVGVIDEIAPHIQKSVSSEVFANQLLKLMRYFSDRYSFQMEIDIYAINKLPKEIQIKNVFEKISGVKAATKNILKNVELFLLGILKYNQPKLEHTPITIFRTKPTMLELKSWSKESIESLGWNECSEMFITTCELNGDHFSIMENPSELSKKMAFCLQRLTCAPPKEGAEEMLLKIYERLSKIEEHTGLKKRNFAVSEDRSPEKLSSSSFFWDEKTSSKKDQDAPHIRSKL